MVRASARPLTDQKILISNSALPTATRRTKPDLVRAETLFHALSDATRLAMLEMLRGGERCVCDLQDDLDAAQSKLSFHLKVLKDAGLVSDRREGRWSYYTIVPAALAEVHDLAVGLQPRKGTLRVLQPGSCCD